MKTLLIILSIILITFDANANLNQYFNSQIAHDVCKEAAMQQGGRSYRFLRAIYHENDEVIYFFKKSNTYLLKLVNIQNNMVRKLSFDEAIYDIILAQNSLFILTKYRIDEYELSTLDFKNQFKIYNGNTSKYIRPYQFTLKDNLFYIAYGELGVKVYDRQTNSIINTIKPIVPNSNGHRSLVSGVQFVGNDLVMSLDNVTLGPGPNERAFEGLVLKNLVTDKEKHLKINQNMEAYHLPYLFKDKDKIYVNNLELYFTQTISNLWRRRGALKPERRHYYFGPGFLLGRALIKNDVLYGCFRQRDNFHQIKSGAHSL